MTQHRCSQLAVLARPAATSLGTDAHEQYTSSKHLLKKTGSGGGVLGAGLCEQGCGSHASNSDSLNFIHESRQLLSQI